MTATSTGLRSDRDLLLRRSLVADAIVVAASGFALTFGAGALSDPLGLPVPLMRITGIGLLPYSAIVMRIATRHTITRRAAWAVVGLNLIWVLASILLLLSGWVHPTSLGITFVIVQALAVAAFADLEYLGLRRSA